LAPRVHQDPLNVIGQHKRRAGILGAATGSSHSPRISLETGLWISRIQRIGSVFHALPGRFARGLATAARLSADATVFMHLGVLFAFCRHTTDKQLRKCQAFS
jgi:hypothetical protein